MKSKYFGTANGVHNKGKENEFFSYQSDDGATVTCFQLEPEELKQIQETGKIWITQLTFGRPSTPIMETLINPFENEFVECECGCLETIENATQDENGDYTCRLCMGEIE